MIPMRGAGRDTQLAERDYQLIKREDTDLTEAQFESVRTAVNIARDHEVKTVKRLITLMKVDGYTDAEAKWAVQYWADNLVENHRW